MSKKVITPNMADQQTHQGFAPPPLQRCSRKVSLTPLPTHAYTRILIRPIDSSSSGMDYLHEIAQHRLMYENDAFSDPARDKFITDSVRAGFAGVTGEDFGIEESRRIF